MQSDTELDVLHCSKPTPHELLIIVYAERYLHDLRISPFPVREWSRRWDIDAAIIAALQEGTKTASQLFRELNPDMKYVCADSVSCPRKCLINIAVHGRTLLKHLNYLIRDSVIGKIHQDKVLLRSDSTTSWRVDYYYLNENKTYSRGGVWDTEELPTTYFILTPNAHPHTCLDFMNFLRLPQGVQG